MARFQARHLLNLCKYVRDLSEVDFENDMKNWSLYMCPDAIDFFAIILNRSISITNIKLLWYNGKKDLPPTSRKAYMKAHCC